MDTVTDKMIGRMVTKYDVQAACDNARDQVLSAIQSMQLDNQAMIRQANAQKDQSWRKIAALEERVADLQIDIKKLQRTLNQLGTDAGEFSQLEASSGFSSFPVK